MVFVSVKTNLYIYIVQYNDDKFHSMLDSALVDVPGDIYNYYIN